VDFDNLQRYLLVEAGVVNSDYPTQDAIELVKAEYSNGQVFYAYNPTNLPANQIDYSAGSFYIITLNNDGTRTVDPTNT
jgi:hypothetical protein